MRYLPKSPADREAMLKAIGARSIDDLFAPIPTEYRLNRDLKVPRQMAESEIVEVFRQRSHENVDGYATFLGAGAYYHYRPVIIDSLISRGEFLTAYTPYQAEVSQGTLQYIFEFQTLICQLTGMEVANASMYDGSTARADAYLMARRVTRRDKIVVADTVHPEYREVARTYGQHGGVDIATVGFDERTGRISDLFALDDKTAALVVQSPNFFGCIEDLAPLAEAAHAVGALLVIVVTEAISLGLLRSPGSCGADIVVGEGQSFGIPMSFGGPHVGLFATLDKYVRQMPGRLAGVAYDKNGNRGFVLTLSTREQHIRREKATSNICTNQGLIALAATIYMETMGKKGLQEVGMHNAQKAAYAAKRISNIEGYELPFSAPKFNEFVVRGPRPAADTLRQLRTDNGIIAGLALSQYFADREKDFLIAVTETSTRAQIDALADALAQVG